MLCNPEGTHHWIRYLLNHSVTKRGEWHTLILQQQSFQPTQPILQQQNVQPTQPILQQQNFQPTNPFPRTMDNQEHPGYLALGGYCDKGSEQAQARALVMYIETLLGLTVRSKKFRPYEFAKRTQLFYSNNITEKNCNFPCPWVLMILSNFDVLCGGLQ